LLPLLGGHLRLLRWRWRVKGQVHAGMASAAVGRDKKKPAIPFQGAGLVLRYAHRLETVPFNQFAFMLAHR
jgi:hypothetical protein